MCVYGNRSPLAAALFNLYGCRDDHRAPFHSVGDGGLLGNCRIGAGTNIGLETMDTRVPLCLASGCMHTGEAIISALMIAIS